MKEPHAVTHSYLHLERIIELALDSSGWPALDSPGPAYCLSQDQQYSLSPSIDPLPPPPPFTHARFSRRYSGFDSPGYVCNQNTQLPPNTGWQNEREGGGVPVLHYAGGTAAAVPSRQPAAGGSSTAVSNSYEPGLVAQAGVSNVAVRYSSDCNNYYSGSTGHRKRDSAQSTRVILANKHKGDNATQWSEGAPNAWFTVDLKRQASIYEYVYRGDAGGGNNHPKTWDLQGSNPTRAIN